MFVIEALEFGFASSSFEAFEDFQVRFEERFRLSVLDWLQQDGVGIVMTHNEEVVHSIVGWDGEPSGEIGVNLISGGKEAEKTQV